VNEAGGIYGRKLVLIDYDDRYEPLETVSATARLINDDKVFALLGYRGTATCDSVASMIREADITFFGPFTGSKRLREPSMSMVYCLRPSLAYEIAVVVDHLIRDLGTKRIAFFGQADSLGENGQTGLESALAGYDLKIAAVGKYVRNSVDLELALDQIVPASPDAIIMAATPQSAIDFLAEARRRGLRHTVFFMLSSIPIERFPGLTEADLESLFLSKLVPSPQDSSIPCARAFRRDMRNFPREKLTYLSFEAYLGACCRAEGCRARPVSGFSPAGIGPSGREPWRFFHSVYAARPYRKSRHFPESSEKWAPGARRDTCVSTREKLVNHEQRGTSVAAVPAAGRSTRAFHSRQTAALHADVIQHSDPGPFIFGFFFVG
jgi:branched-chain amino acid transport system substrate-binding protein